jgi:DNA (cytosine-5)-methyltransferase 1
MLTVGSLFSGIGGLDLGLERAGMNVIWQFEIDPYCNKVLKKHWPEVTNHGNIKDIDWATVERPDVICGGYPCQPFSVAGQRNGTSDPRHLWPWVKNAISTLRPTYAILENVRGHLTLGGLQVIGELAAIGYDAEWRVVSAAGMGAPHRRDRVIIVAYPNDSRSGTSKRTIDTNRSQKIKGQYNIAQSGVGGCSTHLADTNGGRFYERDSQERRVSIFDQICSREFASQWQTEPNVGRVANGVSNRVDRLKGLGNAVVPQVAEYIGHLVMAAHNNT